MGKVDIFELSGGFVPVEPLTIGGGWVELAQRLVDADVGTTTNSLWLQAHTKIPIDVTELSIVRLSVGDLAVPAGKSLTTENIYKQAENLGLNLCPPETGWYQRLNDLQQTLYSEYSMAMNQIIDQKGRTPRVLTLTSNKRGLGLRARWAYPESEWSPYDRLVFTVKQ